MNKGEGVRTDQSIYPNYRTPSRPTERLDWLANRLIILKGWQKGRSSQQIAWDLGPSLHGNVRPDNARSNPKQGKKYRSAITVRNMFQRIYNEAGIHGPSAALSAAYRLGWLPCPCGMSEGMGDAKWTDIEASERSSPTGPQFDANASDDAT